MKREYRCDTGETIISWASKPVIKVIGGGVDAYLWIGNDVRDIEFCFGTLSGQKTLRLLANSILAATKPKKKKRRAKP